MKDHNKLKTKPILKGFFHQLLTVDLIRHFIASIRYFYFVKIRRQLKFYTTQSEGVASNTISHNIKGLKDLAVVRSLSLIRPLSVIENIGKDSKILTVGPRTEGEILNLIGYGFQSKHIRGLDLISYSPWIDLGDMHDMPYKNNSFDVVILGWVLAYSLTPIIAAQEVIRVAKDGSIVAVGIEFGGDEGNNQIEKIGYIPGAGRLTNSSKQILDMFEGHVDNIFYSHNIIRGREKEKTSIVSIFSLKK